VLRLSKSATVGKLKRKALLSQGWHSQVLGGGSSALLTILFLCCRYVAHVEDNESMTLATVVLPSRMHMGSIKVGEQETQLDDFDTILVRGTCWVVAA
jgi:hypothetical protein